MILFINGPFGVGKTSTANELVRLMPRAMLMDPEEIGSFLRRLLGADGVTEDYQDLPLWRALTVDVARHLRHEFSRDLVMPMCVYRREYFGEIIGGLMEFDQVACIQLVAERRTLERRIDESPDTDALEWRLKQLRSLPADFPNAAFGEPIETDGRTIEDVARSVVERLSADFVHIEHIL